LSDARYHVLAIALDELVIEMQRHQLWSQQMPDASALASTMPFCADTLAFEQWLQFVMIPTFTGMIESRQALPNQCDIHTMAEHIWQQKYVSLQSKIKRVDDVISSGQPRPSGN
jgi:uncharacterized protein YqcC (DUF446 family)